MQPGTPEQVMIMTLEAYADTIVPGVKRSPDDRAIAGVSHDGGAVEAGAVEFLRSFAPGVSAFLEPLTGMLNGHASAYAAEHGISLDDAVPAFVALEYPHRKTLIRTLTTPGHPEKDGWVLLAMFSNMAFDSAAHLSTHDALEQGHVGLRILGMEPAGPDKTWQYKQYSYRREFAKPHPDTTPSGSPA